MDQKWLKPHFNRKTARSRVLCLVLFCIFSVSSESYAQNDTCTDLMKDLGILEHMPPEERAARLQVHIQGMLFEAQAGKAVERLRLPIGPPRPRAEDEYWARHPGLELKAEFDLTVKCINEIAAATGIKKMDLSDPLTKIDLLNWALENKHDPEFTLALLKPLGIQLPDEKEELEAMLMSSIMINSLGTVRYLVEKRNMDPFNIPMLGKEPTKDTSGLPNIIFETTATGAGEVLAYLLELHRKQVGELPQTTELALPAEYLARGFDHLLDSSPLDLPDGESYDTLLAKVAKNSNIDTLGKFAWTFDIGVSVLGEPPKGGVTKGTELAGTRHRQERDRGKPCHAEFRLGSANTNFPHPSVAEVNTNYSFSIRGGLYDRSFPRKNEKDRADIKIGVSGEHVIPACNTNGTNGSVRQWVSIAAAWNVYDNDGKVFYVVQDGKNHDTSKPIVLDRSKGDIRVGVTVKLERGANGPGEGRSDNSSLGFVMRYYNDLDAMRKQRMHDYFRVAALAQVMRLPQDFPVDLPNIPNLRVQNSAADVLSTPYVGGEMLLAHEMPRKPPMELMPKVDGEEKQPPIDPQRKYNFWFDTRFIGEYPILYFITRALENADTIGLDVGSINYLTTYRQLLSLWCKKHHYPRIRARAEALARVISNQDLGKLNKAVVAVLKADKVHIPQLIQKLESLIAHGGLDPNTTVALQQELHYLRDTIDDADENLRAFRKNYNSHLQRAAQEYNDLVRELSFYVTDEELKAFTEVESWIENG